MYYYVRRPRYLPVLRTKGEAGRAKVAHSSRDVVLVGRFWRARIVVITLNVVTANYRARGGHRCAIIQYNDVFPSFEPPRRRRHRNSDPDRPLSSRAGVHGRIITYFTAAPDRFAAHLRGSSRLQSNRTSPPPPCNIRVITILAAVGFRFRASAAGKLLILQGRVFFLNFLFFYSLYTNECSRKRNLTTPDTQVYMFFKVTGFDNNYYYRDE